MAPRFFSPGTGWVNAGACTEVPSHGGDTGSPTESEAPLRWAIVYEEETDLFTMSVCVFGFSRMSCKRIQRVAFSDKLLSAFPDKLLFI